MIENIIFRMYYNYVNKMEMATSLFNEGFNCSQALLTAYGVELGLNREVALKIASLPESSKIIKEKCHKYIRDACAIIEEIIPG